MKTRAPYKILINNNYKWMFIDRNSKGAPNYYSYRHYVLNIFFNYIKKNQDAKQNDDFKNEFQKELEILKNVLNTENYGKAEYRFFKYLKIPSDTKLNELVVYSEHSDIYPLFIKLDKISKQQYAFSRTIDNVLKNLDEIIEDLRRYKKWTKKLQQHLDTRYYDYDAGSQ